MFRINKFKNNVKGLARLLALSMLMSVPALPLAGQEVQGQIEVTVGDVGDTSLQVIAGKLHYTRVNHQAVPLSGSAKILIVGGNAEAPVAEVYDPVSNTATKTGPLLTPRGGGLTATRLGDGRVLIAGGSDAQNTPISSIEIYDPANNVFTAAGNLNVKRGYHTAEWLPGNKVLIAGGAQTYTDTLKGTIARPLDSAELYDPLTNTSELLSSRMSDKRYTHSSVYLDNGKVLLVGGSSYYSYLKSADLYDPAAKTFTATGAMQEGRAFRAAAIRLNGGKALVSGGYNGRDLASMEIYNSGSGRFTTATSLQSTHKVHAMSVVSAPSGGELVAVIGGIGPGQTAQAGVEIYNATDNTISVANPLLTPRQAHSATYIEGSGKLLIAGGLDQQKPLDTVEIYEVTGVNQVVAAPSFSMQAGTYTGRILVTLNSATPGADFYYTTDGSQPSLFSSKYNGVEIPINTTAQLKAIAVKGTSLSAVSSVRYTINNVAMKMVASYPPSQTTHNISVDAPLEVRFNLEVTKGPAFGMITLNKGSVNDAIIPSIEGNRLQIKHANPLEYEKEYTIHVPLGAVKGPEGQVLPEAIVLNFFTMQNPQTQAQGMTGSISMESPYKITDSDQDHVYFDGDTLSLAANFASLNPYGVFPPPGSGYSIPGFNGTLRVSLGIYADAGAYDASKPILKDMRYDEAGNYHYLETQMVNGAFSISGSVLNPGNSTLPTGIIALKMVSLIENGKAVSPLVTAAVPLLPADKRITLVGVPIPTGDFTMTPEFKDIKNFYSTEQELKIRRPGNGSITFPKGLNLIDNRAQLWALRDNMMQDYSSDLGGLVSSVNSDSLTFLTDQSARLTMEKAMERLQIVEPNITTERLNEFMKMEVRDNNNIQVAAVDLPKFIDVSTMVYDAVTDTLSFPVKHFTSYVIKKKAYSAPPVPVVAEEDISTYTVKAMLSKQTQESLTIRFNQPVVASTLLNHNIKVIDAAGVKISDVTVAIQENSGNQGVVLTPPASGWTSGTHTLLINTGIGSVDGMGMKSGVKIKFIVS